MKPIKQFGIGTLLLGAVTAAAFAQVEQDQMGAFVPERAHRMQQPYAQQQQPAPAPAPAPAQPPAVTESAATPPSLLDKPAQPAKIDLTQGQLSIHADNSSLIDIMHRLTADAGMTVDGLSKDQRVFGTYGPGDPQDVISELLDGTGYNVAMLGRTESGTPKQVTLTPRSSGAPNGSAGLRPQPLNQLNQDDDVEDDTPQQPMQIAPPVVENPPSQPPGAGVRTPQQMLQELQQMRQQQMQQMQQQGQPQPPPQQQQ